MKTKQKLFFDIDDIVLNSSETAIQLLNEEHNLSKTPADLRDWDLHSIYRSLSPSALQSLFSSSAFWSRVTLKPAFVSLLHSPILTHYDCYFISKGTQLNHHYKQYFLRSNLQQYYNRFTYIPLTLDECKSSVDMSGAIQIDDNISFLLPTNAHLKLLVTNLRETSYNNAFGTYNNQLPDNLYILNDLDDVASTLAFNLKERL